MKQKQIRRGNIYYADLNLVVGSEQDDSRPVLVVQSDTGNRHSPTIVVAPITCNANKKSLPTHVTIPHISGLSKDSRALVEQILTIDCSCLYEYIGRISDNIQSKIDDALAICVGINNRNFKKAKILTLCLCPRCERDFIESGCVLVKKGWQETKSLCDFCETRQGLNFGIFNKDALSVLPSRN